MTPRPDRLLAILPFVLRPLVRLMLGSGITLPVIEDLLRRLFVEVATDECGTGGRMTDSRVSLMTGVHRKEVKRLRAQGPAIDAVSPPTTLNTEILARWLGAPGLQDAAGDPIELPRTAGPGAASFDRLVASVTSDLRPRTVLDAWIEAGIARWDPVADTVTLLQSAYVPQADDGERLFFFARNLGDHVDAACHNVAGRHPAFPDASVNYDELPEAIAATLEAEARTGGMRLLREINRTALDLLARRDAAGGEDGDAPPAVRRVNFGIYLFSEQGPSRSVPAGAADIEADGA